ncbi:hypothetical protein ACQR16_30440 [Bradyrhizobium oligotrophicum]
MDMMISLRGQRMSQAVVPRGSTQGGPNTRLRYAIRSMRDR